MTGEIPEDNDVILPMDPIRSDESSRIDDVQNTPDHLTSSNRVTIKAESPKELLMRDVLLDKLKDKPPWRDFLLEPLSETWVSKGFRIFQGHPLTKAEDSRDASGRRRSGANDHHPNGEFIDRFGGSSALGESLGQYELEDEFVTVGGKMFSSFDVRGGRYVWDNADSPGVPTLERGGQGILTPARASSSQNTPPPLRRLLGGYSLIRVSG